MTGEAEILITHELKRLATAVDGLNETVVEQGKALVQQSEAMKSLARKQDEMQVAQKELAVAMTKLSEAFVVFQCKCDQKSGTYLELDAQVNGPEGLATRVKDATRDIGRAKALVLWTAGVVGTLLGALVSKYWDKLFGSLAR